MPRNLYSPRLSDDVIRSLYREGLRRQMPMTRLADELLRESLDKRLPTTVEEPPAEYRVVKKPIPRPTA